MTLLDHVDLAAGSLRRHPLRTALTMLGIVIGVAAVVAMVSIGLGARSQIEQEISRLGSNLLMVIPSSTQRGGVSSGLGGQHSLTESDAAALQAEVFGVTSAVPAVTGAVQAIRAGSNWKTRLVGTLPGYLGARDWAIENGRNISAEDVETAAKVAVVGRTVTDRLSPDSAMIGDIVRINRVPFRVIGLLAPKGHSSNGRDQDDVIIVPISSAKSRLIGGYGQVNRDAVEYVLVKLAQDQGLEQGREAITRVLRGRHMIGTGRADDFVVRDPSATLAAQRKASETLTILLASIAAVSLLVGGISVMNIMLVSVTERTREIGLRVAVGAKRSDIFAQFLSEAGVISTLGGLVGAGLGIASGYLVERTTGWMIAIDPWSLVGAMLFSAIVGIVSGFYPAILASRLDPVAALAHE